MHKYKLYSYYKSFKHPGCPIVQHFNAAFTFTCVCICVTKQHIVKLLMIDNETS